MKPSLILVAFYLAIKIYTSVKWWTLFRSDIKWSLSYQMSTDSLVYMKVKSCFHPSTITIFHNWILVKFGFEYDAVYDSWVVPLWKCNKYRSSLIVTKLLM